MALNFSTQHMRLIQIRIHVKIHSYINSSDL
jgi:hypothetical protein